MKKGILIMALLFLSTSLFGQDIINTVGTDGEFAVKENDGIARIFTVKENPTVANDPQVRIGTFTDIPLYPTTRSIQLSVNASFPQINIQSNASSDLGFGVLNFTRKYGTVKVSSDDVLGSIAFRGYTGHANGVTISSEISSTVASSPADNANYVATKLEFKTSPGGYTEVLTRMTIGHTGTITIPDLDINTTAYVLVDNQGNLYSSATAPTSPAYDGGEEFVKRLDDLEKENIELKREIAKIKSLLAR